jgi:protein SCO1/2
MIDQDSNSLQMNSFKGFDVVLTFIYTNCPVPDYCPLMSYNFKQLYQATSNKVVFISFSFDPERDTPQVLKAYGSNYVNTFERWKFVTAKKNTVKQMTNLFSVITQAESDQIIHNLRTVHINKDGIVEKIWPDNTWTVDEVLHHLNHTNQ